MGNNLLIKLFEGKLGSENDMIKVNLRHFNLHFTPYLFMNITF